MPQDTESRSTVSRQDLDAVQRTHGLAARGLAEARHNLGVARKALFWSRQRLRFAELRRSCLIPARRWFHDSVTVAGGFALTVMLGLALGLVLGNIIRLPLLLTLATGFACAAVTAWFALPLVKQSDEEILDYVAFQQEECDAARGSLEKVRTQLARALKLETLATNRLQEAREKFQAGPKRPGLEKWRAMKGLTFQDFIAQALTDLGYTVEKPRAVGGHRIGLIASRDGRKTAIQVKGSPGNPVGNRAVQEADAGIEVCRCDQAAVITNSRFTSGAKRLGENLHCNLVDVDGVQELLGGKAPF